MPKWRMNPELKQECTRDFILYQMEENGFRPSILMEGDDQLIEPVMIQMQHEDLVEMRDGCYAPTRKGHLRYNNLKARRWSAHLEFEIFQAVDLGEGRFASPEMTDFSEVDDEGRPIWEDVRVAVVMRKAQLAREAGQPTQLDPYRFVFLLLLSEDRIGQDHNWQFDLRLGSEFFQGIEEIVGGALHPEEMGYDDVRWEQVIDDVIRAGYGENARRLEEAQGYEDLTRTNGNLPPQEEITETTVVEEYEEYDVDPYWGYYNPGWILAGAAMDAALFATCWAIIF